MKARKLRRQATAAGKQAADTADAASAKLPDVLSMYFACTGRNKKEPARAVAAGKKQPQPNCWSVCGFPADGSVGCCPAYGQRQHRCGYRMRVTATLADVAAGRFLVRLRGVHVPPAVPKRPPSTLETARASKMAAVDRCLSGAMLPVQSSMHAYAEMSTVGGAAPSSRFVPTARDIAAKVKTLGVCATLHCQGMDRWCRPRGARLPEHVEHV